MTDLEDALKKLDRLTQEEVRMAHEEALRIRQDIRDDTKIVDGKVEEVCDKVQGVAQVAVDGTRAQSNQWQNASNLYNFRR